MTIEELPEPGATGWVRAVVTEAYDGKQCIEVRIGSSHRSFRGWIDEKDWRPEPAGGPATPR